MLRQKHVSLWEKVTDKNGCVGVGGWKDMWIALTITGQI